jgi:peptide/nickel transport system substrate-binding protein
MIARHIAQLSLLAVLLAACTTGATPVPSSDLAAADLPPATRPTLVPTFTPRLPTPVPSPAPTPAPRTLTICVGEEPATLALYGESEYARDLILEAIYDAPIDMAGYVYEPVILEKLPSLDDGDAVVEAVPVQAGDRVVISDGRTADLAKGMAVRPAGCREASCTVDYDGGPLEMDQMSVTFRLLPGITWSDGTPLTAADSVVSFQLAKQAWTEWQASTAQSDPRPDRRADRAPVTASYNIEEWRLEP